MAARVTVNPMTMYSKNMTLLDRPHPIWSGIASGAAGGGEGDTSCIREDAGISIASGEAAERSTRALRKSETASRLIGLLIRSARQNDNESTFGTQVDQSMCT
jgi:hypothetical protein